MTHVQQTVHNQERNGYSQFIFQRSRKSNEQSLIKTSRFSILNNLENFPSLHTTASEPQHIITTYMLHKPAEMPNKKRKSVSPP